MNRLVSRYRYALIAATVAFCGLALFFFGVPAIISCSSLSHNNRKASEPAPPGNEDGSTAAIWTELLQKKPFPDTAPLPSPGPTVLDGTYAKFDPKKTPPVPCRRCPDYVPEGGIWKLNLRKG